MPAISRRPDPAAAAAEFAGLAGFAAFVSRGVTDGVLDRVQAPRVLAAIT